MKTKKLLLAALTAMCAMTMTVSLTACSHDDNPAEPTTTGTTITIIPAYLYVDLGITEEVKKTLADGDLLLYYGVLLYDQQGNLATQFRGQSHSLDQITIQGDGLADGTYTLVAFQMLDYEEPVWEVVDADRLADVHLSMKEYYCLSDVCTVGMSSQTVTVSGGGFETAVMTRAAGCLVETRIDNFSMSDKPNVLLLSWLGYVTGFYLDPARPWNERTIIEDPETYWMFSGAYDERLKEGSSSWQDFALYRGENVYTLFQGYCMNEDWSELYDVWNITLLNLDYLPRKKIVVYHDFDQNQLYQTCAGSSEVVDGWLARRAENPYELNLFTRLGASLADVESFMNTEYKWWTTSSELTMPYVGDTELWRKEYYMDNLSISYDFATADGQDLVFAMLTYTGDQVPMDGMQREVERLGFVLYEQFVADYDEDTTVYHYKSAEGNTIVQLRQHKGFWDVSYMDVSYTEARNQARAGNSPLGQMPLGSAKLPLRFAKNSQLSTLHSQLSTLRSAKGRLLPKGRKNSQLP